jgi:hypothetical protein
MTSNGLPHGGNPNVRYTGLSYCSSEQHIETLLECIYKACNEQEWEWYIQFVAHILCSTHSAAIAASHLKTFLRGRTNVQLYHEGIRSEIYDPDDVNLPSVLTLDKTDPVVIHFKKWTLGRVRCLMGNAVKRKIARNAILKLLWVSFDIFDDIKKEREEQAAQLKKDLEAQEARRAQERQSYFKEQQPEPFPEPPPPGRGMLGVIDLGSLLRKLSLEEPQGLSKGTDAAPGDAKADVAPTESWIDGLLRQIFGNKKLPWV